MYFMHWMTSTYGRVIGTALEHLQHEDAQSMGGEQE